MLEEKLFCGTAYTKCIVVEMTFFFLIPLDCARNCSECFYLPHSCEKFENVSKAVMERCGRESGQASRIDAAPQAHYRQQVTQHDQNTHIPQQTHAWHVMAILDQWHRAQQMKHEVSYPLNERL